jgi:hypothetical protein
MCGHSKVGAGTKPPLPRGKTSGKKQRNCKALKIAAGRRRHDDVLRIASNLMVEMKERQDGEDRYSRSFSRNKTIFPGCGVFLAANQVEAESDADWPERVS